MKEYHSLTFLFLNFISDNIFTKETKTNPSWKPSEQAQGVRRIWIQCSKVLEHPQLPFPSYKERSDGHSAKRSKYPSPAMTPTQLYRIMHIKTHSNSLFIPIWITSNSSTFYNQSEHLEDADSNTSINTTDSSKKRSPTTKYIAPPTKKDHTTTVPNPTNSTLFETALEE